MQMCRVREREHVGYLTREHEAVEAIGVGELESGEGEGVESASGYCAVAQQLIQADQF
jgi:hypothetical protein